MANGKNGNGKRSSAQFSGVAKNCMEEGITPVFYGRWMSGGDKAHGEIERADMLGQRTDGDVIDAGQGVLP